MNRVVLLHAYSSENLGDGLLVDAALAHIRTAVGPDVEITMFASRPESFSDRDCQLVSSKPNSLSELRTYVSELRNLRRADLVVGVGGGYLRFGSASEAARTALVHGPQLVAASLHGKKAVYLPQSIGPLPLGGRSMLRRIIGRIKTVYVRDDRSLTELEGIGNVRRAPDMAIWADPNPDDRSADSDVHRMPVLSTRYVRGTLPAPVTELAGVLGVFDGYVQSTVGQNNDVEAVREVGPREVLTAAELLDPTGPRRVVVAMRLHAALMAINAGHYVIHLAYERKGFGAFSDLGLSEYVHRTSHFDPALVAGQARLLLESVEARGEYDRLVRKHRATSLAEGLRVQNETGHTAGVAV